MAQQFIELGFDVIATRGTAKVIEEAGLSCEVVNKVKEGRPHVVDRLKNHELALIVNTTEGARAIADSFEIRRTALQSDVAYTTTVSGAQAIVWAMQRDPAKQVRSLQSLYV